MAEMLPQPFLEMLNFDLKPRAAKLVTAAFGDPGPVSRRIWAVRASIPFQHVAAAANDLERMRAAVVERVGDSIRILVQPFAVWRGAIRPRGVFLAAWQRGPEQSALDISTEWPGL